MRTKVWEETIRQVETQWQLSVGKSSCCIRIPVQSPPIKLSFYLQAPTSLLEPVPEFWLSIGIFQNKNSQNTLLKPILSCSSWFAWAALLFLITSTDQLTWSSTSCVSGSWQAGAWSYFSYSSNSFSLRKWQSTPIFLPGKSTDRGLWWSTGSQTVRLDSTTTTWNWPCLGLLSVSGRDSIVYTQSGLPFPSPGDLPNPGTEGLGRSPGEGKGCPLQYSGLENPTDCIVHVVNKESDTTEWLSLSYIYIYSILSLLSNSLEAYAEKIDKSTNHTYYKH